MKLTELLLFGLVGWTAVGLVGTTISRRRGERRKARRGLRWIAGAWVLYFAVLLGVSWRQPTRVVPLFSDQCFDEMCFAVVGADELNSFAGSAEPAGRLVRVHVRIRNHGHGHAESEKLLRGYLVDSGGRQYDPVRGLSGVPLTAPVPAGGEVVSEPVFLLPRSATGLGLVLTHGRWQPGTLVIGDSDSLLHRRTVARLTP